MKLKAEKREVVGKKVKTLRAKDVIPAGIFGPNAQPQNIQVSAKDFKKIFSTVGFSNFFDLEIEEGKPVRVLVKDVQIHPLKDTYVNVNFYQIDENKKINVDVPVELVGEAPAVTLNLGFLVEQLDHISLYCLPKDLPHIITIDISVLENVGDTVTVGQIPLPENVELSSNMDATTAIAYIGEPQKEEEEAPAATEEVEATAEGEAAAATTETTAEKE